MTETLTTTTYPTTRAYRTTVARISRLSEHFVRFTFADEDLQHFGTGGLDQRIKLMLPRADGTLPEVGLFDDPAPAMMEWYSRWRQLPDEERNPLRTYTVRDVRPEAREIDVDFVLHGTQGPASAWAMGAGVGDELVILGPDERSETGGRGRSGGIEWDPGTARSVLLVGDETAAPAICAVLETLDAGFSGHVFLEVPSAEDILPVDTRAEVQLNWLARGDRPHGEVLTEAVRAWGQEFGAEVAGGAAGALGVEPDTAEDPDATLWEVPPASPHGHWYAWLAGEAGTITGLRRHLVKDLGIDKKCVSFMGYWKQGRAEGS
ncbi:siderophore-interacting protein [Microbacterium sp. A93]|uniref:siderophore-interacting protein n=1 Tax=Microbacterium sp. A93 TaxID=3450716 RepID=UPI003F42F00A